MFLRRATVLFLIAILIGGATMSVAQPSNELDALVAKLSAGDRSVLRASLQRPAGEAQMMTAEGSANHELWEALAARGWMVRLPVPKEFPPELKFAIFALTATGHQQIPLQLPKAMAE